MLQIIQFDFTSKGIRMDRKERLKLTKTPEKSIVYDDDSLFLPTPSPKSEGYQNRFLDFIKKYGLYIHLIFPYSLLLCSYLFKSETSNIEHLIKEINLLKRENVKLIAHKSQNINYARIEKGTAVFADQGDMYKYGILGFRRYNDPNVILNDNVKPGECLSFKGCGGMFVLKFKKKIELQEYSMFHPDTNNRESSVREFEIVGYNEGNAVSIGRYVYDFKKEKYQSFKFNPVVVDKILINILSNNGHRVYTTVYKIFVFGKSIK